MDFEKSKMVGWDHLPVFLALARHGTLTAAAQRLKMAPSSVARHIEQLEQELGAVLFQRSPQGYLLTEAAHALLSHAEQAESAVDDLIRHGAGFARQVTGTVRIALPENFATRLVIPALPAFQAQHPALRVELVTSVLRANLTRREADIALRLSRPEHGNFIMSRIGRMASGMFASPAWLAAHPADLTRGGAGLTIIGWDDGLQDMPLPVWLAAQLPAARTGFTASSLQGHIAAAAAGLGIAAVPVFLADGLARIGDAALLQDIYLLSHGDIRRVPRIDVTMRFLREVFQQAETLLAGELY